MQVQWEGPSRKPAVNTNFSDMEPLVVEFPTPLTGEFVFVFSLINDAGYEGLKLKAYINDNNSSEAFSISKISNTEVSFQHLDSTYSRTFSAQLTKDSSQSHFFTQLIKLANVSSMRISGAGTLLKMKRAEPVSGLSSNGYFKQYLADW